MQMFPVIFVSLGPGEPELITVKGLKALQTADCIFCPETHDVKAYEVFDKDGSFLAVFYADFHPRKGKQGGAWMTEFQGQWIDRKGVNVRPHVSVVMNLTKPTDEKPALLTLGEVETFLHEFGHSLHGMFANTRFESLSGTNVWWDFVDDRRLRWTHPLGRQESGEIRQFPRVGNL